MSYDELVAQADRVILDKLGGTSVTYAPEVGDPVEVDGMFDEHYVLADGSSEAGVELTGPGVFLLLADLPTDPEEDEPILTIHGQDYRVISRSPDGFGGIVLGLRQKG